LNPLRQTTKATAEGFISTPVECTVFQRLTLLRRLQDVKLSPDEAWAVCERIKTNTSSAEDRAQLAHLIRVTLEVTTHLRADPDVQTLPVSARPLPKQKVKRKRQLAKATRRRHGR
jgi:hypothetical protein